MTRTITTTAMNLTAGDVVRFGVPNGTPRADWYEAVVIASAANQPGPGAATVLDLADGRRVTVDSGHQVTILETAEARALRDECDVLTDERDRALARAEVA